MKQLIDQTVASVRRISADLRPVMLDNLGLAPTLEWLTRDFAARAGLSVELVMPDEDLGASGDAATAIFRITQEALTNVVRHAQATNVRVEIMRVGGDVRVRISDDGCGLNDADQRKARSFGLLGMRERAYVLGGGFSVRGDTGKGTTVEATIPAFGTVGTAGTAGAGGNVRRRES
jgi:signal transduction histidine kinase